jgi:F-type H+-transporting ATPase subunit b
MLIDWFTVGAQVLNFLILVWLLKRFLYKPILHAIDEREKRIAKELADADAKKGRSQKERDEFQLKNEEFDQQREALLSKAKDEARAERQRLLDEARQAADALSAKRQDALKREAATSTTPSPAEPSRKFLPSRASADGSRRDKSGRTHGRGVHAPLARAER